MSEFHGVILIVTAVVFGALPFLLHRWCLTGRFP